MKTYFYTYDRKKNDSNGNPVHFVKVFRIKNNVPFKLHEEDRIDVGYRDADQAVCDTITLEENLLFSKKELASMPEGTTLSRDRKTAYFPSGASYSVAMYRYRKFQIELYRLS